MRKRREALKEMPRALYDAFGVTIERIQNQKPEVAQQAMDILKWVFLAKEPLTVEELQHALAVEPQDKDLDWENFIHEELLLECCLGLVIIDESTRTIRLVHKSLQDYLKTQYDEGRLFQEAHYEITRICLTYMSFYGFDSEIQTLKTYKSPVLRLDLGHNYDRFFEKYVLIKYATIYWSYHAVTAKSQSHAVDEMVLNLLQDKYEKCLVFQALLKFHFDLDSDMECKVHWYGWCREELQSHMLRRSTGQDLKSDILYVLVLSGLEEALRRFIKSSDVDVNISHWSERTLLSFAAQWGRTEVLKLLLDLGAEVDPMLLVHACESGHLEAAKVLLDRGANVNSQHGVHFYSPLEFAAEKGHMEIVKLLLDQNNVNVDIKNSLSQTPLIAAVQNAHTDVLKLLLDRGADANLKDSDMRTPYSSYSAQGKTPLHYAVQWNSNKDILELLLEYGAVVDSKDKYGETPLFCSIMRQQLALAEFLLERGADINSKNNGGWTVLMQLIHSQSLGAVDSFKIVNWILAQPNVDINWRAPNGWTALS
ncbi:ankyrin repeat-containing domain protein [Pyronema domesticum]|nr:ankyrin repeat-containing domain protein [Pyronema domesticum]